MRFSDLFAKFIVKFRWPICILVFLVTLYFTYLMQYVTLPKDLADIAPQGHPYVKLQGYMNEAFGVGTMIEIVMEVKEGDVFNSTSLGKLRHIGMEIRKMKGVMPAQVISVATHSRVKNLRTNIDPEGFSQLNVESFRDLSKKALESPEQMTEFRRLVLNNENLYGKLVSWDKKSAAMLVHFWNDKEFKYIFQEIRQLLHSQEDANHKFYVAGRVIEMGFLHQFMGKMIFVFGVATVIIILILWAAFGTWRGMLMPLWAAYVAVVWGLGSEYLLGFKMDIMTVIVPFFIMAIEVSHCIQILSRFYEEFENWGDAHKAAEVTLSGLVLPGAACIVTDGGGFGTLILIPFKLLQQMGISASFGILRIFVTTTVFIHAFVAILPPPTEKEMKKIYRRNKIFKAVLAKVADLTWGTRGRNLVLGTTALLLVISLIGASRLVVGETQEGSPLFWADSEVNQAERLINAKFYGTNPYMLHIAGNSPGALADPKVLMNVHALQRRLEERADVSGTSAYPEVVKGINMAFHDNDPRWYVLPNEYEMTWQFMDIFRNGGGPEDSKSFFEMDYSEGAIAVFVKDHKASTIHGLIADTDQFLKERVEGKVERAEIRQAAGIIGIFSAIIDEIYTSQISSLWQIYLVIFVFVAITFRSFMASIIIIIPLAISNVITFATMGFGDIGLFIYTVPVATLGTGLGDYSMYIMSRMQEEAEAGKEPKEIFYEALTNSGRAVFFTCFSISVGVATLLLSSIRFQAIMGGMLMVALLANMLGAIVLLPTLINWWRPKFVFGRAPAKVEAMRQPSLPRTGAHT